ncbi:MAG TPA: hypothetical protein VG708_02225 [Mycobacteriales bacterium]|nr:hypothetical protein [Mycobacteriales bacterium]
MTSAAPTLTAQPPALPAGPLDPRALSGRLRPSTPWTNELLAGTLVANLIGLAVIAAGGYQANQAETERTGLSWLVVSLLGLAICGAANAIWLLRVRRYLALAVGVALDPGLRDRLGAGSHAATSTVALVVVRGTRRYHRAGCPLVAGKRVEPITRHAATETHTRCEVCEP